MSDLEDHDPGVDHGQFLAQLSSLEGKPRFLHHDDGRDVSGGAPLLGSKLSLESMLEGTKEGSNIRKELVRKKDKKRKDRDETEEEQEEQGLKKKKKKKKPDLTLDAPLSTPSAERATRAAGYARLKEDVSSWDAVVHSRRAADTVSFPLAKPDLRLASAKEASSAFKPRNPLEEEVMALLRGSKTTKASNKELSEHEERILANMTLQEALEKRRELARLKVLQSYQVAKMKRQGKIKSKKFRKIARKEREKEKERELEELKRIDPELAAEKMAEMENVRILERANLRHRNNSKYLQQQAKKAKKAGQEGKDSQRDINLQIQRHRELVTKITPLEEEKGEDEEGPSAASLEAEEAEMAEAMAEEGEENPWLLAAAKAKEDGEIKGEEEEQNANGASVDEFNSGFKEFWEKKNAAEKEKKKSKKKLSKENVIRERLEMVSDIDDLFNEASRIRKEKLSGQLNDDEGEEEESEEEEMDTEEKLPESAPGADMAVKSTLRPEKEKQSKKKVSTLDPDDFVRTTKIQSSTSAPVMNDNEEDEEEETEQGGAIAEAFADDDVAVDFAKEKKAAREASKPKTIDLTLPGWGSWGGDGLTVSKRKRKRFTVRAKPEAPRKDANKGNLILNETKSEALRSHQPDRVPFPFTSVKDFEASIRTPVGETFVPRTAFKKMTAPKVKTRKGAVIEAMDREELVRRKIVDA